MGRKDCRMSTVGTVWRLGGDDWRAWRAMRLAALASDPAAFGSTLAEWTGAGDSEERWRHRLETVRFNALVLVEGEPVGMVGALEADGEVELVSLWVAPAFRGRGVGDTAVLAVLDFAAGRPVLLSVRTGNAAALALYRRHGFLDAGPSPEDPRERLMRRP
jgi:ribosomal protein S18 acetylase RimI-like enzyme